ncbi:MAG: RecQ family zinc-binding domain-containing protein [Verrucomicrobiales bacterium]
MIKSVYAALGDWADESGEVRRPIREIAARVGEKNEMAVSSAFSLLVREGYLQRFDVPGERVRGTRLLRPGVSAGELEIDEQALREKEERDRSKLKAIVSLAYSDRCRQQWILEYFGEQGSEPCGSCDCCREQTQGGRRAPDARELLIARKALSGVARMSRRTADGWEGRFGRGRVVQMLVGSRSREILSARLDELSTYGLLREEGSAYLHALLRELEGAGLVCIS